MRQVKMASDVPVLIQLEAGMTITATLEKDAEYTCIGEFTNEITGAEMVVISEEPNYVPFAIETKFVEFI